MVPWCYVLGFRVEGFNARDSALVEVERKVLPSFQSLEEMMRLGFVLEFGV